MSITPNIPDTGDGYQSSSTPRWVPIAIGVLFVALGGGMFWLHSQSQSSQEELRTELTAAKTRADQLANALEETNQRLAQVSGQQQVTSQKLGLTQDELARARSFAQQIQKSQEEQQSRAAQLNAQLGQVRQENEAKFGQVTTDLSGARNDIAATRKDLEETKARLSSTVGDLGVQSGLIARTREDLEALKRLGERNIFDFNLVKSKTPQRIGPIQMRLTKADVKKNKYTVLVVVDDRSVEKKDRTVAEPVQFLVRGARTPYEVVVMEVAKDRITGYLSTPKEMASAAPPASAAAPVRQ
jgi:septal ring factor EnvC (AmiA/AmiB activator)